MSSQQCQAPSGSRGNLGRRVLRQRQNNGWKSRKLPGRLASETDCHVQLKASRPLTGQLAHTAPSQIYSHGQSADRDRPALFSAKGRFWRKAVGRINDLIGSSKLVYSKVIRPPIGTLDADQGTQSAL
jgi:hypothetical protein